MSNALHRAGPIAAIGKDQRRCRDSNRRKRHQLVALRAAGEKEQRGSKL